MLALAHGARRAARNDRLLPAVALPTPADLADFAIVEANLCNGGLGNCLLHRVRSCPRPAGVVNTPGKKTGDVATKGELLIELETGKALIEVRAPGPCVLRRILFEAGTWTRLGRPLAILSDTLGEAVAEAPPEELADLGAQLEIV